MKKYNFYPLFIHSLEYKVFFLELDQILIKLNINQEKVN